MESNDISTFDAGLMSQIHTQSLILRLISWLAQQNVTIRKFEMPIYLSFQKNSQIWKNNANNCIPLKFYDHLI